MAHTLWIVLLILVGFFAVLGFILGLIAYLNEGGEDSDTSILAPEVEALTQVPALYTNGTFKAGMYFVPSGSYSGNHSPGILPGQPGVTDYTTHANFDLSKTYGHWNLLGEICWIDMGIVFSDRNFALAAGGVRDEVRFMYLSGDLWPEPYFLKSATLRFRVILEDGTSRALKYAGTGGQLSGRIISDVGEVAMYKNFGHREFSLPTAWPAPYDTNPGQAEYPIYWEELDIASGGNIFGAAGTVELRLEGWYWAKI